MEACLFFTRGVGWEEGDHRIRTLANLDDLAILPKQAWPLGKAPSYPALQDHKLNQIQEEDAQLVSVLRSPIFSNLDAGKNVPAFLTSRSLLDNQRPGT